MHFQKKVGLSVFELAILIVVVETATARV